MKHPGSVLVLVSINLPNSERYYNYIKSKLFYIQGLAVTVNTEPIVF